MIVQADDGMFYKDPTLHSEDEIWFLRFDGDICYLYIKRSNKREAKKITRDLEWVKLGNIAGQPAIEKTKESFPPNWSGREICFEMMVEVVRPLPVELIIDKVSCFTMEHLKALTDVEFEIELENGEKISKLKSNLLIFSWEYTQEELSDIYLGKRKSFLFGLMSLRQVQASMRKQLKIRNIQNLPEKGILSSI